MVGNHTYAKLRPYTISHRGGGEDHGRRDRRGLRSGRRPGRTVASLPSCDRSRGSSDPRITGINGTANPHREAYVNLIRRLPGQGERRSRMTTTLEIAPAAPSAAELGPVRPSERIAEMDILRGFALLGILVVNLFAFYAPLSLRGSRAVELYPGSLDKAVLWIMDFLVSRKFIAMFSFLFGVGFAIQMDRAAARGAPFAGMYLRRMVTLLAFGLAHAVFLWDGDILHVYAGIGLALILVRKLRDRWLWGIVACCALLPIGHSLVTDRPPREAAAHRRAAPRARPRPAPDLRQWGIRPPPDRQGQGDRGPEAAPAGDRQRHLSSDGRRPDQRLDLPVPVRDVRLVLADDGHDPRHRLHRRASAVLPGHPRPPADHPQDHLVVRRDRPGPGRGLRHRQVAGNPRRGPDQRPRGGVAGPVHPERADSLRLYMGAVVLLAQRPVWRAAMSPLASVGRMPLTNYLMQSVIATTLFYGYAFGLYYRIGPAVGVLIAFAIYAVQVAYSAWWMARFRFGPMEWLWRHPDLRQGPRDARADRPAACRHSPRLADSSDRRRVQL